MKQTGKLLYWAPSYGDPATRDPDVVVEMADGGSIGISVPMDGAELTYFSPRECRMVAEALMIFAGADDVS